MPPRIYTLFLQVTTTQSEMNHDFLISGRRSSEHPCDRQPRRKAFRSSSNWSPLQPGSLPDGGQGLASSSAFFSLPLFDSHH